MVDFQYSRDGKRFLLSATKDGQSDIFIYTILNTKVEQLTDDVYSDLNPTFVQNDRRVVWSSNRPTDSLIRNQTSPLIFNDHYDLFAMRATEPELDSTTVLRVTNSADINEQLPEQYAPGYVAFISDRDEIRNRHLIKIDSSIAYVDTTTHYEYSFTEYAVSNYPRSILWHGYMPERDVNLDVTYQDGRFRDCTETPYQSPEELSLVPLKKTRTPQEADYQPAMDTGYPNATSDVPLYYPGVNPADFEIDIYNYRFEDARPKSGETR
ncbi:MAG: hypothetical protein U5L96_18880 [Owenweeksia sp.]|nr:hypothetical protein [Owenweeksia sp.]